MRALYAGVFVVSAWAAISCSDSGEDSGSGAGAGMGAASGASGSSTGGSSAGTGTGGSAASATGGAGGAGGVGGGAGASSGGSGGQIESDLIGYWVWEQKIEDGTVTLTVTDADMESKVGPSGWEGCPEGILCTKYGIQKLAFGPEGQFWRMNNVKTGSDSNLIGSYTVDGSTVTVNKERNYSCAHPEQNEVSTGTGYFAWKIEGDRLWVSSMQATAPTDPTNWLVLKPVSETDFYGKYMVRICQDYGKEPKCYQGCFSNDYGK